MPVGPNRTGEVIARAWSGRRRTRRGTVGDAKGLGSKDGSSSCVDRLTRARRLTRCQRNAGWHVEMFAVIRPSDLHFPNSRLSCAICAVRLNLRLKKGGTSQEAKFNDHHERVMAN